MSVLNYILMFIGFGMWFYAGLSIGKNLGKKK